jgi:acyl-CoA thioesterase FadM
VVLRVRDDAGPGVAIPDDLLPFTTARIGAGKQIPLEVTPAPYPGLHSGRGVTGPGDPVLAQLLGAENAFGWRWRVPYFYCHFNERLQMSGYLRIMEETEDLFLADRGLPIKQVLDTRRWIPVVTQSRISLLDEAIMEEELYTVYTVEDIFKDLLYTARMDCYVIRDGALVQTATGSITHGYLHEHAPDQWQMATMDVSAVAALSAPARTGR